MIEGQPGGDMMPTGLLLRTLAAAACAMLPSAAGHAQEDLAAFYKGKSINLYIGAAVGGGYDAYARLLGRHIGKYIPGNPNVIPINMPGASGNTVVAHIYNLPKDATTIAQIPPGAITKPIYGEGDKIRYDFTKLVYLGSANTEVNLCWSRSDAEVKTFSDLFNKELIIGGSGEGDSTRDFAVAEKNILGTKFKLILRYTGVRDIVLAVDRNEIQGVCGTGVPAMMTTRPEWISSGFAKMLVQQNAKGSPKLNALGVPRTADFAKTPEDRKVLELIYAQQQFGRPFVMPPGSPPNRVAMMRKAFLQVLADKDLLAEAEKLKLDIDAMSGDELQGIINQIYATPKPIVDRAIKAMGYAPSR
jgi:tripartite-type tricarboxylate transporter receptor subunit TctC